jgi:hypothetical protein
MKSSVNNTGGTEVRPWYREPWPWVLIAIPLLTVIASAFTFWLAVSHPDYLVVEAPEYQEVKSELRAESTPEPVTAAQAANQPDGYR